MTFLFLAIALLCVLPLTLLLTANPRVFRKMLVAAVLLPVLFGCAGVLNSVSGIKYMLFGGAVLLLFPAVMALLLMPRWIRWVVLVGLLLPTAVYQVTSINFFSQAYYTGTSRGMEISLIHLTAGLVLLLIFLLKNRIPLVPDLGCIFYLIYFLLCLPSLVNADNRLYSWFELWRMMMVYLVFLAVYAYLEYSHGDFAVLLYGAGVLVAVNFLFVIQQHAYGRYQAVGFFPHWNSMAMFMETMGTLFLSRFLNRKTNPPTRGWLSLLICGLAAFAVFRSYSRGAAACFPIGALVTVVASLTLAFLPRKIDGLVILAVLGATAMVYLAPRLFNRFDSAPKKSWETRVTLAKTAKNMIEDKPWNGVGLNNWNLKMKPPYSYNEDTQMTGIVETIYLLVAAECGIPCLVALLLWFGYYLWVCLKLMWRLRRSQYFYLPAGLFGGLISVYLQSALEWVLKQQLNFIWLLIFFAVLSYLNTHWRELLQQEKRENSEESLPTGSVSGGNSGPSPAGQEG